MAFWRSVNAESVATLLAGFGAIISATLVARRQQKIKEQELRLSLLNERRLIIREFRGYQESTGSVGGLDDEIIRNFFAKVQDVKLYFDPVTAKSVEDVFAEAWNLVGATASARIYRDEAMHDQAREELRKRQDALSVLLEKFPVAIRLMVEKTRVPDSI
ncbi:hypothetical protein ATE59_14105 [Sphingopyxis sp. A083]|nr:hypothetical protein ATE59_14105 [Sphingopyxis sp. A083]